MTAVEWLEEQINPYGVSVHQEIFEQAKAMEKERIIKVVMDFGWSKEKAEQYYKETFKS